MLENNPGREEWGLASVVGHELRLGEETRFHLQQHTYTPSPPPKKWDQKRKQSMNDCQL